MARRQQASEPSGSPQERFRREGGKMLWRTDVVHVGQIEMWLVNGELRLIETFEDGNGTIVFRPE